MSHSCTCDAIGLRMTSCPRYLIVLFDMGDIVATLPPVKGCWVSGMCVVGVKAIFLLASRIMLRVRVLHSLHHTCS